MTNKQPPTIKGIGTEFMKKYCLSKTVNGKKSYEISFEMKNVMLFYHHQIEEILEYLEGEEKPMSKHFKATNKIELTRDKINSGFNQAVKELNKRIKRVRGEIL